MISSNSTMDRLCCGPVELRDGAGELVLAAWSLARSGIGRARGRLLGARGPARPARSAGRASSRRRTLTLLI